ncbi:MAG: antibiotic biosynthesis monooxygenase [Pseudacidovorax sp.]|jgi:quinol monooxygenase YgiN|uniref:putative quinol monooxygenase n=1 Tax=Pseudacidovorax sp. TaxID=1934311 RepID=UPI001B45221D|nr:antibiotic biosynthesis monooxygenase [Pseudacidovorax sp.]MBP6892916.1 antibiotic biosynthesis monooxygenase [Pseudacidovorax sp.]
MNETYVITFHVKPAEVRRFHALLDGVLDAMRGEATFVRAALHVDPDRPYMFQLHETWSDRQDVLTVQLQRDYRRAWHAALEEILAEPRSIAIWTQLRADP